MNERASEKLTRAGLGWVGYWPGWIRKGRDPLGQCLARGWALGKPINYGRWNRKDDMRNWTITEDQARQSAICVGCGQTTDCPGGVVCWACFKGGPNPLKYFGGTFAAWQAGLPELNEEPFRVLRLSGARVRWSALIEVTGSEDGSRQAVVQSVIRLKACQDVAVSVKWKGEGIMGRA